MRPPEELHVSRLGVIRVLMVEDDVLQQMTLQQLFEVANEKNEGAVTFDVTTVGSATEALTLLSEDVHFSLILLDMLLPDHNGYDVLPRLREKVGDEVAIVMASVESHISFVQLCVRRGADAFLVKPLGCEEVRHIWQFLKDVRLPDGSFKTDIEQSSSFTAPRIPPDGAVAATVAAAEGGEATSSCAHQVLVCAGCCSSAESSCSMLADAGSAVRSTALPASSSSAAAADGAVPVGAAPVDISVEACAPAASPPAASASAGACTNLGELAGALPSEGGSSSGGGGDARGGNVPLVQPVVQPVTVQTGRTPEGSEEVAEVSRGVLRRFTAESVASGPVGADCKQQ